MPHHTYKVIDPDVLMQLAGDRNTFRMLSQTFVEHAPKLFMLLVNAMQQRDFIGIAQHSHALKGMTTLIGALRLSAVLQSLEAASRDQKAVESHDLEQLFANVVAEVTVSVSDDDLYA